MNLCYVEPFLGHLCECRNTTDTTTGATCSPCQHQKQIVVLSIPTVAPRTTGLRTDQSVCLHACQIDTIVHHSMLAICSGLWGISPLCARGLWSSLLWTSKSPRVLLERQRRPHTPSLLALGSACPLLELPTACLAGPPRPSCPVHAGGLTHRAPWRHCIGPTSAWHAARPRWAECPSACRSCTYTCS